MGQDFTPSVFDRNDGSIPLNPNDPSFDPWAQFRDPANDPDREPGPFYPGRLRNAGVLTFFNLPIAINPSDLTAGNVDVAILGAPIDMGVGMRGAANGPKFLRESLGVLDGGSLPHMHVGVAWKRFHLGLLHIILDERLGVFESYECRFNTSNSEFG